MARCKTCGAEIIWIRTMNGKMMPCNAEPVPYWYKLGARERVATPNGEVLPCTLEGNGAPDGRGYIPHWATCPGAGGHRLKR